MHIRDGHMMNDPTRAIKPEEEELAKKKTELSELESRLADGELFLTALRAELSAFEQTYIRKVGKHYAELDEIEAKIAERVAQKQPENERARNAATQARSQAQASRTVFDEGLAAKTVAPRSSQSQNLKSLYREIAKRIHPDLATDSADRLRKERLMAAAIRKLSDYFRVARHSPAKQRQCADGACDFRQSQSAVVD